MNREELGDLFNVLNTLRHALYSQPHCSAGGPLHVVLDHFKTDDKSLEFCEQWMAGNTFPPDIEVLAKAMLHGLRMLTRAQRFVWLQYHAYADAAQEALDKASWQVVFDAKSKIERLEPPRENNVKERESTEKHS